ncbi:MAG: hypothetical protein NXI09_12145 [Bacteroidetes bacterium]|nr:hypothetical protein [Bacteroidota bacterium]
MRFLSLLLCFISLSLSAQKKQIVPIQTFPVNGTIMFKLEGTKDRAVLKVDKVEPNKYDINKGDTLICTFFWTTNPVKDEMANFPGVKAGDQISFRMGVQKSPLNGAWQYTVYHYKNRTHIKESMLKAEGQ